MRISSWQDLRRAPQYLPGRTADGNIPPSQKGDSRPAPDALCCRLRQTSWPAGRKPGLKSSPPSASLTPSLAWSRDRWQILLSDVTLNTIPFEHVLKHQIREHLPVLMYRPEVTTGTGVDKSGKQHQTKAFGLSKNSGTPDAEIYWRMNCAALPHSSQ